MGMLLSIDRANRVGSWHQRATRVYGCGRAVEEREIELLAALWRGRRAGGTVAHVGEHSIPVTVPPDPRNRNLEPGRTCDGRVQAACWLIGLANGWNQNLEP